jgi:putative tricarboxylic transport membrane protein
MSIGEGHIGVFFERPISAVVFAICLLVVIVPRLMRLRQRGG